MITIKPVKHPRYAFRATFTQGGKYIHRFFKTEKEANAFAGDKKIELLNEGRKHGEITDSERRLIIRARELATSYAAKGFGDFSLDAALDHYCKHLDAAKTSIPIMEAYDQFHAAKVKLNVSRKYLSSDVEGVIQRFAQSQKPKLVSEITTGDVAAYLDGLKVSAATVAGHHNKISVFLAWCSGTAKGKDKGKHYAATNAATGYAVPSYVTEEVGILTVKQAAALIGAASPEITAALAVALFAGIRIEEIRRMDWSHIDLKGRSIRLPKSITKTKKSRVVEISPNLYQWLKLNPKDQGPVSPSPQIWRNRLNDARNAAGITKWPHNAARHSCASYAYDLHQNAALVAAQLGHDVDVLESHYKGLVKRGEGKKYFAIKPTAKPAAKRGKKPAAKPATEQAAQPANIININAA
jgi:integrase